MSVLRGKGWTVIQGQDSPDRFWPWSLWVEAGRAFWYGGLATGYQQTGNREMALLCFARANPLPLIELLATGATF